MANQTLQASFTAGELSPSLHARVDFAKYSSGCKRLEGFLVQPHGGAVKRPGFLLVDVMPGEAALHKFYFNAQQAFCLCFGEKWLRIATADGFIVKSGSVYQVTSPYTLEQAKRLSIVQNKNVLYIACSGMAPRKLTRNANDDWAFSLMVFDAPVGTPSTITAAKQGSASTDNTPYTYVVTALNDKGQEGEASAKANVTGPPVSAWVVGDSILLTWTAVDNAAKYNVYKTSFSGMPGLVATVTGTTWSDFNSQPSGTVGPPIWDNLFPTAQDYPSIAAMHEQRLVFMASQNDPQSLWMSRSGAPEDFSYSDPLRDDDAIDLTLASNNMSPLCWGVALRSLVLGADSVEWNLASLSGALTARTAYAAPQSYWGSTGNLPALVVGNTILHITRSKNVVRELRYDFSADSYGGVERTILATHLFENHTIKSWTYQQTPDSIIWAVRDDGLLLGLTYQQEHDVYAWHRHSTQGEFRCVASVPGENYDHLFAVILRDGAFYLEVQAPRYYFGSIAEAVFMDCALVKTYPEPVREVTGLDLFEGKTLGVLGDGAVQPDVTVNGGKVTLRETVRSVVLGFGYHAELETLPIEMMGANGNSVTRKKSINAVNVRFKDTMLAHAGVGGSLETVERKARSVEPYGSAPDLYSGTERYPVNGIGTEETVRVVSDEPLPVTVLAISPEAAFT